MGEDGQISNDDGNDCPICSASEKDCATDKDCAVIVQKIENGGQPSSADLQHPKMQAITACHQTNCPYGADDDDGTFDLVVEVKKLLLDLGLDSSAADAVIQSLGAVGQALEEAVMPAGATAPDMTKLFDNTVFTDAVTGAGVDLDEAKAAAASFEYDGGNNGDDSASAISAAAAVVAASIVAALL